VTDEENERVRVIIATAVSEAYAKNAPMGEHVIKKLQAQGFKIAKAK
jgi:hypothetical protein